MKYLRKFNTSDEYDTYHNTTMDVPNVCLIKDTKEIKYNPRPLVSFIFLNQNLTEPASIISGDVNGHEIQKIRAGSHRYLGKYTSEGTMTLCQLDDADSTKFVDGTNASLSGTYGDVFMKLPRFWYKAEEIENEIWKIGFSTQFQDSTWKEWDGNDLIGVYEAYVNNNKVYSRSGVVPSASLSQSSFSTYAKQRGEGFSLVKWKHHSIMAFLFYAMYGNTDSQSICGFSAVTYPEKNGATDSLGMTDTTTENGNTKPINFWGLEGWWGNLGEWVDNVLANGNDVWTITEDDGSTRIASAYNREGCITKVLVSEHLDVIPTMTNGSTDSFTTGFCDAFFPSSKNSVLLRSSHNSVSHGGVACVFANNTDVDYNAKFGSRLAFRGTLVEAESVEAYKSLSTI